MNADDFVVYTGNTKYLRVTLTDPDGSAHNLTGESINFVAKATKAGDALITKNLVSGIEVVNAAGGVLKVSLLPADTTNLTEGSYYYEIKVTSALNEPVTVLDGLMVVKKSLF